MPRLTLHEAMQQVMEVGVPTTYSVIADRVARGDLYRKKDGYHPAPSQIGARANNYPDLFRIESRGRCSKL